MERNELKLIELMGRQGMRRVLHGSALHLFAVTRKQTKTLRAETDHGTLRVQKQGSLHHDIRYNQRQRGRRNCKSAAVIKLHNILVLQLSLRLV
jgi:hypothetical protein